MGASQVDHVGNWLRENAGKYGSRRAMRDACASELGREPSYVQKRVSRMMTAGEIAWQPVDVTCGGGPEHTPDMGGGMGATADIPATVNPSPALSEASLRAEIDVHFKARAFLESIQPGQFYPLEDAAIAAGIPRSQARQVFIDARYAAYRGRAISNNRTYLGHPDRIAAMKQERIML